MRIYGYLRGDDGPDLDSQRSALAGAGCMEMRHDPGLETDLRKLPALASLLREARKGDTLVVYGLDRLAGSVCTLRDLVERLNERKTHLRALRHGIDTSTSATTSLTALLDVLCDFEMAARRERHMRGVARAKAQGAYKGRPRSIDADAIRTLAASGHAAASIASELGISRASVYRVLNPRGQGKR